MPDKSKEDPIKPEFTKIIDGKPVVIKKYVVPEEKTTIINLFDEESKQFYSQMFDKYSIRPSEMDQTIRDPKKLNPHLHFYKIMDYLLEDELNKGANFKNTSATKQSKSIDPDERYDPISPIKLKLFSLLRDELIEMKNKSG